MCLLRFAASLNKHGGIAECLHPIKMKDNSFGKWKLVTLYLILFMRVLQKFDDKVYIGLLCRP